MIGKRVRFGGRASAMVDGEARRRLGIDLRDAITMATRQGVGHVIGAVMAGGKPCQTVGFYLMCRIDHRRNLPE